MINKTLFSLPMPPTTTVAGGLASRCSDPTPASHIAVALVQVLQAKATGTALTMILGNVRLGTSGVRHVSRVHERHCAIS